MQILVAISIYGFILWPCMFVFGLIMTLMPLYAHAFA